MSKKQLRETIFKPFLLFLVIIGFSTILASYIIGDASLNKVYSAAGDGSWYCGGVTAGCNQANGSYYFVHRNQTDPIAYFPNGSEVDKYKYRDQSTMTQYMGLKAHPSGTPVYENDWSELYCSTIQSDFASGGAKGYVMGYGLDKLCWEDDTNCLKTKLNISNWNELVTNRGNKDYVKTTGMYCEDKVMQCGQVCRVSGYGDYPVQCPDGQICLTEDIYNNAWGGQNSSCKIPFALPKESENTYYDDPIYKLGVCVREACQTDGGVCTTPPPPQITNVKPSCNSITVSKSVVNNQDEQITISASGQDSDNPGSILDSIGLVVSAANQTNKNPGDFVCKGGILNAGDPEYSYYCDGLNVWSNLSSAANTKTVSYTTTYRELKAKIDALSAGYAYNTFDNSVIIAANVVGDFPSDLCSSNPARNNGNGVYSNNWTWNEACSNACRVTIKYEPPPPPQALKCNDECTSDAQCNAGGSSLVCDPVSKRCRNDECKDSATCNCPTNNPPTITSVSPSDQSSWIGTATDSDNGPQCSDNNPYTYSISATDPDGSTDIDRLEVSLARNHQFTPGGPNYWPLKVQFAKEYRVGGVAYASEPTFYIRDKNVDSDFSTNFCYRSDKSTEPRDLVNNLWCFGTDSHTYVKAGKINTTLNGKTVTIYYPTQNLKVFNDGYETILKAPSAQANWKNSTYVAYYTGSDQVDANFQIEFLGNETSKWKNLFENAWRVSDLSENPAGSSVSACPTTIDLSTSTYLQCGKSRFDLIPPKTTLNTPIQDASDTLKYKIRWNAADQGGSGLRNIYGEANRENGAEQSTLRTTTSMGPNVANPYRPWVAGGDYTSGGAKEPFLWNWVTDTAPLTALQDEIVQLESEVDGNLVYYCDAIDNACNKSAPSITSVATFTPWLYSSGGFFYSEKVVNAKTKLYDPADTNMLFDTSIAPFDRYPYNSEKRHISLSSELITSGTMLTSDNLTNSSVTGSFALQNYVEKNNRTWFKGLQELSYKTASKKDSIELLTTTNSTFTCAKDNCSFQHTGDLSISNVTTCQKRSIVFVNGNLDIKAPIIAADADKGCIFVVSGNVNVDNFSSTPIGTPEYDRIEAFILSDGNITFAPSTNRGVQVWGGIVAIGGVKDNVKSISLNTRLEADLNTNRPSYTFEQDPRYLKIARTLLVPDSNTYKREVGFSE